jgi:hypothetical protein
MHIITARQHQSNSTATMYHTAFPHYHIVVFLAYAHNVAVYYALLSYYHSVSQGSRQVATM